MPLSRRIARINRAGLNRVSVHVADRVPGWALLLHRGRRSGTDYRTPISVFVRGRTAVIALTYGSRCDWAQNVLAAGECTVIRRGRRFQLVRPRVVTAPPSGLIPAPARAVLRLLRVEEYLQLEVVDEHH